MKQNFLSEIANHETKQKVIDSIKDNYNESLELIVDEIVDSSIEEQNPLVKTPIVQHAISMGAKIKKNKKRRKKFNNAMMKQAKKMQEKMKIAQEEIAQMETEGSSGGIKIKMLGGKTIEEVEISDKLFEQKDKSLLERFIKDAVNDASNKADKVTQKKMKKVTGGIKIPGLF